MKFEARARSIYHDGALPFNIMALTGCQNTQALHRRRESNPRRTQIESLVAPSQQSNYGLCQLCQPLVRGKSPPECAYRYVGVGRQLTIVSLADPKACVNLLGGQESNLQLLNSESSC